MLWEPFGLERRRLRVTEREWLSGEGVDYCAVRQHDITAASPGRMPVT